VGAGALGPSLFGATHDVWTGAVPAGAVALDVAVTWDSPVEDLDLALRRPDGTPAGTAATSIAQLGATMRGEVVHVDDPPPGPWAAEVSGFVTVGRPYRLTATVLLAL
jgi:hypothetical protein